MVDGGHRGYAVTVWGGARPRPSQLIRGVMRTRGAIMRGVLGCLAAVMLLPQAVAAGERTESPQLAGVYDGEYSAAKCTLVIHARSGYSWTCAGKRPLAGSVLRHGNIIGLALPAGQDEAEWKRYRQQVAECEQAAEAYRHQQFREHGFYPALAPCGGELANSSKAVAPVAFRGRLYLVDLFARETFCAKSGATGTQLSKRQGFAFRSRQKSSFAAALAVAEFCAEGWKMSFED
jgi:hypothetical protein